MNLKRRNGGFLCVQCGCPIVVRNAMAQRALESGRSIKCDNCRRGKPAGQLWPSYEEYLASYTWQVKAEECKRRAGRRCQVCNSPFSLEAHHRVYDTWGDESINDLLCTCRDCHAIITEHVTLYIES